MNDIPFEDKYMDVLQNIEAAIHYIHVDNPELSDYDVDRALELLVRAYQGEARGKKPIPPRSPVRGRWPPAGSNGGLPGSPHVQTPERPVHAAASAVSSPAFSPIG